MGKRSYGQYCGFARALEVLGERWGLLVVRDLLNGPKRFTDLLTGLPGIPSNVLTNRLKDMERFGVVERRALPHPERGVVYTLTAYGRELEDVVLGIGRWGAKTLKEAYPGEVVTPDSLIAALRSTFHANAARDKHVAYELRAGPIVVHARIDNGKLETGVGPPQKPDLIIEAGPAMRALMARELTPSFALKNGNISITGDPKLLKLFADLFQIDPMPART